MTISNPMMMVMLLMAATVVPGRAAGPSGDMAPAEALHRGGSVLMIRHALAPGSGDPDHFKLGDCTTQRNLSEQGRDQARAIGAFLRRQGVAGARVYASQWCRCLETASLMDVGTVQPLPALNSFFARPEEGPARLKALRSFLDRQPRDGPLIIMVTHFVTISALTGKGVSSGEGVVLLLEETGLNVRGHLTFDETTHGHAKDSP
jgi:phosphohistidine phosphatase SixA